MSRKHLEQWFARADKIDMREGMSAYLRYNQVMVGLSQRYGVELTRVTGAFCALSPNNDYAGNLRSTVSVLDGWFKGIPCDQITVSTYKHCRNRAYAYVAMGKDFLDEAKGLKIRNFYCNIIAPEDFRWVTIDGHVCAIWRGDDRLTMKEALIKGKREYNRIADTIKAMAFENFILPNQLQAVLWFTRKRVLNIKFNGQHEIFGDPTDVWRTYRDPYSIEPFPARK
jgi:hypothetical protein